MFDSLMDIVDQNYNTVKVFKSFPDKYLAWIRHKETNQDLVIRRYTGDPESYKKLLKLRSPYLPEIYEVATKGDQVLVLEEYIPGDSVFDLLKDSVFPPKEVRKITLNVCRALYILHYRGIIHRDIKPEHILLRGSSAVLLDFDAARLIKSGNSSDTRILGTVGYAPPEQYGLSQTDERSDIYALGVTMNLMLTGTHPSVQLAPGRLGRIISRCTMMQPDQRYDSIKKIMEVLM